MTKLQLLPVRIEDLTLNTREGIGRESNRPYKIVTQNAYVALIASDGKPEKYPVKMSIDIEADANGKYEPYPLGDYTLGAESFMVGDFQKLKIGRMKLVAMPKDPAK